MEKQDIQKVIEIEGVKLSSKAITKIFYLQHWFHKNEPGAELNFNNEAVNAEINFINQSIHFMLDMAKDHENQAHEILEVLWCLSDYKNLLDLVKAPDQNI